MGEAVRSSSAGRWLVRAAGLAAGGVAGMLVFAVVTQAAIGSVARNADGAVSVTLAPSSAGSLPPMAERSLVVGPDGVPLATLHGEVNRRRVPFGAIPEHVWRAVLAAEDRSFFEHDGYDVEGISRAAIANYRAGAITQGGSTLTQQLAKAAIGDDRTLERKIEELVYAIQLEREHSKHELLERYLNQVYFGAGAYGIGAAAEEFFATEVGELRVEQAALLAGQIQSPARTNPRENPETARQRRNAVLSGMAEEGWLPPERAAQLEELPLGVVPRRDKVAREPYIVDAVKREFFSNPAFGDTREERIDRLFTDGLRITTTIDPELQDTAERIVRQHFPERGGVTAAIAAVDPRDGRVLTAAFGREFEREQFNLALQGRRQPGSAFKPFVMATALERGLPPDLPVEGRNRTTMGHGIIDDDETWVTEGVRNYGGASFSDLDMTEAMHRSVNTAFAQVGLLVGLDRVQELTYRLGISERAYTGGNGRVQTNPSMSLGGLTRGVSPLEMASAYGAFATAGERVRPHVVAKVEDRHGNVIYEADHEGEQALSPGVTATLTDTLRGVVTQGTGTAASIPGWPVAGKTGTTQRNRDVWFVGYTPVMSTAVWVGHPSEDVPLHGMSSSGTAAPLWHDFMQRALRDRAPADFPEHDAARLASEADEEEVEVPQVRGLGQDEAISRLTTAGLVASTVGAYHDTVPAGAVVWQSPNPGETASFGSTAQLGVSRGPEPKVDEDDDSDGSGDSNGGDSDDSDRGDDDSDDNDSDSGDSDDSGNSDEGPGPPDHAGGPGGRDSDAET